ncbi:hypothetical protein BGX28_004226 [Mortierella sp. GBA30]|nr:hypothetical protein BGX28_004226 [Mortierella sp. GBA30]
MVNFPAAMFVQRREGRTIMIQKHIEKFMFGFRNLTDLRHLSVNAGYIRHRVKLALELVLGALATLTRLRKFNCGIPFRVFEERRPVDVVEWMLEYWTNLELLKASPTNEDVKLDVLELLQKRGVAFQSPVYS